MYRQVLVVGLGGSGGKTLRYLRRDLTRWLSQNGWDSIPAGWQFLQIDSPTVADGLEAKVSMLPDSEYLGLVGASVDFAQVAAQLDNHPMMSEELATWRVAPGGLDVSITKGAGQYRAIGRTVALAYLQQIQAAIASAMNKLTLPIARADLDRIYQDATGKAPTTNVAEPLVIVVSSLAGGSGAGLLNDVCDIIRSQHSWGKPIGILYTPEVFNSIVGPGKNGVQPNSLAAISEVLNGYWWHGEDQSSKLENSSSIPLKLSGAMQAVGAAQAIKKTGPEYPFLVGARNSSGISYPSDNQLFETVGSALLSWLNDEKVQSSLDAHAIGNWKQMSERHQPSVDVLVNRGAPNMNEPGMPSFNALGFGRVSVGTKYFETYASELITRDAVNHMRTYHINSDEAQQVKERMPYNQIDVDQVVSELATSQVLNFMRQAGLDEKGPTNNQIIDALRPEDSISLLDKVIDIAMSSLAGISGTLNSSDWQRRIESEVAIAAEEFARSIQPSLEVQITNWILDAPTRLMRVTEEFVAAKGLRVTQEILKQVGAELVHNVDSIVSELANEENAFNEVSLNTRWSQTVISHLTFGGKVPGNHQSIASACSEAIYQACCGTWARIHSLAQDLIEEFERDVVNPLSRQLGDAFSDIEASYSTKCMEWPLWSPREKTHHGQGSPQSTPAKSEWTLLKPEEFGNTFDGLLTLSKPGLGEEDQRNEVRKLVISGSFVRDLISQSSSEGHKHKNEVAIEISQQWWPSSRVSPDPLKNRTPGNFKTAFRVQDIQRRAVTWLHSRGSAFEDVLNSSLISYTMPDPQSGRSIFSADEFRRRQQNFIAALSQAMAASDPLVGLDTAVISAIYEGVNAGTSSVKRTYSMLPFKGHILQSQVEGMLLNVLGNQNEVNELLDSNGKTEHIDIVSWFEGPYPVFVFESLLKPIAESWMSLCTPVKVQDRRNFWTRRRARGLSEFIPAPQEHIICMLRGWFTANMLGLIDSTGSSFRILQPRGINPQAAKFPDFFLSPLEQWGDIPAVVLESLGLAYVEVCRADNLRSLDAYIALRNAGQEGDGTGDQILRYSDASHLLVSWIFDGKIALQSGATLFKSALSEEAQNSGPVERKAAILNILENVLLKKYAALKVKYDQDTELDPNLRSLTPLWPSLWPQIEIALNQLITAVHDIEVQTPVKSDW
jgi:hypothetical protein